jgi:hypothetical protein
MIHIINVFEEKRYERMKFIGHNLIFKRWMISVESSSAIKRQCQNVFVNLIELLAAPLLLLLSILSLLYMIIPKVFIKRSCKGV